MRRSKERRSETGRGIGLRRSLLVRLLAVTVLVSVGSIGATAWLVMRTTTAAIRDEQGQSLADDAQIYDTLVGYGAGHRDWRGAAPTVARLARRTGRRITITTPGRRVLVGAGAGASLPKRASARLDPLAVDPALAPADGGDRIDPRAVGPFLLPARERRRQRELALRDLACVRSLGGAAELRESASGRATVAVTRAAVKPCQTSPETPTATERRALLRLTALTEACLRRRGQPGRSQLVLDADAVPVLAPTKPGSTPPGSTACLQRARRRQLRPHVAPPALLFVSGPRSVASTSLDLSRRNQLRTVEVGLAILLLALVASVLAARRLVRPLRSLTEAAERMEAGDSGVRVDVDGRDELARLGTAFNAMARRREILERQRTEMVADVAHELRTPVGNIRGWLEATQDGVAAADAALVTSLLEEAELLQHLIGDLQDLSAADAGELRLHPEPVAVGRLLEQVADAHRPDAERQAVTIAVDGDRRREIVADPVRLRQAVGNLTSNAIRHSPRGGEVTLSWALEPGAAVIAVHDHGTGIAADDLPRVFDRFWRADRSRSRRAGGSGLGLAIVRKLAEAHGGSAAVTSTVGVGTTFRLRLPTAGDDD